MGNVINPCFMANMEEYRRQELPGCSGNYHDIVYQWKIRSGYKTEGEEPIKTTLCEGHLPNFKALGMREKYQFEIVKDELRTATTRETEA